MKSYVLFLSMLVMCLAIAIPVLSAQPQFFDDFSGSQSDIDGSWGLRGLWQWNAAQNQLENFGTEWAIARWGHCNTQGTWLEGGPNLASANRDDIEFAFSARMLLDLTHDRGAEMRLTWTWNHNRRYTVKFLSTGVELRFYREQRADEAEIRSTLAHAEHNLATGDWVDVKWVVRGHYMEVYVGDMSTPLLSASEKDADYDIQFAQMNGLYPSLSPGGRPLVVDSVAFAQLSE